jgi:hypothetical protein
VKPFDRDTEMTTTAPPSPVSKRRLNIADTAALQPATETHASLSAGRERTFAPQRRGPATLFEVSFASAMSDSDLALLARTLDMTFHMSPKLRGSPAGLGIVRLDNYSGLFLRRGAVEGEWVLEARTWGHPAPQNTHEWHVLAAGAARLLDPNVAFLERLAAVSPGYPMRPVGRAANTRLSRIGRRILRL